MQPCICAIKQSNDLPGCLYQGFQADKMKNGYFQQIVLGQTDTHCLQDVRITSTHHTKINWNRHIYSQNIKAPISYGKHWSKSSRLGQWCLRHQKHKKQMGKKNLRVMRWFRNEDACHTSMALWVPSLEPTWMWEEKTNSKKLSSDLHTHTVAHVHTQ